MKIKDKVIIITGAASGIGEATAVALAGQGAKVVLADISVDKLRKMEKRLHGSLACRTDMTKDADVKNLITKTIAKFGWVDILINNAGRGLFGRLEETAIEDYQKILDLNVVGYLRGMQAVIPIMKKRHGGMILNVSSLVSKDYYEEVSAYTSTKYAVNALSLIARKELKEKHIIVSVIHPNATATNFYKNGLGRKPAWGRTLSNMDTAEHVGEAIVQLIQSEKAEAVV
jgi:NADP-dependent 3-hydroxy acid dehydrogenase YdfG